MEIVKAKLQQFIDDKNIPHLLFYGPNENLILDMVMNFLKSIYGNDRQKMKTNIMMVNCAQGKGIKFIREDLKLFAKTNISSSVKNVAFKSILLIAAEKLTVDAQSALRRSIELFSYSTRFFIITQNKNRLLSPILSRFCDLFLPEESVMPIDMETNRSITIADVLKESDWTSRSNAEMAHQLFETAISSPELMQFLKERLQKVAKTKFEIYFYDIKLHCRSESLLLFCLLEYYALLLKEYQ